VHTFQSVFTAAMPLIVLKRSQPAERRFQVALCVTGRVGQAVPLMGGGAEIGSLTGLAPGPGPPAR
jgi:hypothetical protein